MAGDWITPDADWIAKPADRDARYWDALRAIGPPPHCDCFDECRARREWHMMVNTVFDTRAYDRERMAEGRC